MTTYLLFLPLFYLVYGGSFFFKSEKTRNAFLDMADSLPVLLLPFLNQSWAVYIFLIGCIFANVLLRPSPFIGGPLYLVTYGFVGILTTTQFEFSLVKGLIAFGLITIPLVVTLFLLRNFSLKGTIKGGTLLLSLALSCYAYIALMPCLYAFFQTWNLGFLMLILGDVTLIFNLLGFQKAPWYLYLSNCIFYTGVVLVPLYLQTI